MLRNELKRVPAAQPNEVGRIRPGPPKIPPDGGKGQSCNGKSLKKTKG